MAQRFYQVVTNDDEYNYYSDHSTSIVGMLMHNPEQGTVLLLTPEHPLPTDGSQFQYEVFPTNTEQMSQIIRLTDDPRIFEREANNINDLKAVHRKVRYQISGAVQQQIWVRDGLKCMFCERRMGDVQLTIDHFHPLDLGGANDQSNYLSACRKCNKQKGSQHPKDFCDWKGIDYQYLVDYLNDI